MGPIERPFYVIELQEEENQKEEEEITCHWQVFNLIFIFLEFVFSSQIWHIFFNPKQSECDVLIFRK